MNVKIQFGRGQAHAGNISAMPNEVLLVHEPDPNANKIIKVNDISETRYAKIIAVGDPRGKFREAPVKVGDVALMATATAGVAVPGVYYDNRLVHRLDWRELQCVVEEGSHE
jgi:hypothetical protein